MVFWYWLIAGLLLLIIEIVLPSFTALWFAFGAFILGVLLFFIPSLSLTTQLLIWTLTSGAMAAAWFLYFRQRVQHEQVNALPLPAIIGQTGTIIHLTPHQRQGELRFHVPVAGVSEWSFRLANPTDQLQNGDRVRVVDIQDQLLIVEPA